MSALEERFAGWLDDNGLGEGCSREFVFAAPRRWRFDFAWPDRLVAVEIEGAVFVQGRHTRGAGFVKDCEKYNTATVAGWRPYRVPGPWLRDPERMRQVRDDLRVLLAVP